MLILKLGKGNSPTFAAELGELVRRTEAAIGKRMADAAPVVLINQLLSDADMAGLCERQPITGACRMARAGTFPFPRPEPWV
ncbi:hypothetical protein [Azospirillum himalayense]|uniref:Uncharacterized protein n=1 Tax=Azospirillum himalayense TaxID=654847 RepID=A0ABW0GD35_9PROT